MIRRLDEFRIDKPWGYELRFAITDRYLGKLIHVDAGQALSLQYHVQKDEAILVLGGELDLVLEDDSGEVRTHRLTAGMSIMNAHTRSGGAATVML